MGHNLMSTLNPFNPRHDLEKALDPAGSTIRAFRGVPTNAQTVLDPANAALTQSAPAVPYATSYSGATSPQIPAGAPLINPQTNMRAGAPQATPMATSIGSLGGKNQFPMPQPQVPQNPGSGGRVTIQPVSLARAM